MYANTQIQIFLSFEHSERRKNCYFLFIFSYYFSFFYYPKSLSFSENGKNQELSPCQTLKSFPLSESLSITYPSSSSSPHLHNDSNNQISALGTSSTCSSTGHCWSPLPKKLAYPGPFIKGQVGTIFFSLKRPRNYMEIPHGYSLIINSFHLRRRHELVDSKYVIVDPLGNSWSSLEVFAQWRRCIENHEIEDLDLSKVRLAIVRFGNTFKLCTSDKKSKYTSQMHIIPSLE